MTNTEADRLREKAVGEDAVPSHRHDSSEPAPLSYAQQRLWFLDQIDPGKPFSNIPRVFRIRGRLDIEALQRSLETMRSRHEVLSSVFQLVDGDPVQVVAPHPVSALRLIDLSDRVEIRDSEAMRIAEEEAWTPFDLAQGPLLRAALLRLGPEEHVFLVTVHRAVFDERSRKIFDRELAALYEAYHEGQPSPLPPLPIQYADFAIWQREWLRGRVSEEQLAYWKRQLRGAPAVLALPASRRRPEEPTFRGATETAAFGPELTARIRSLCQGEGVSLFTVLLAAFQVFLQRHSSRGDVSVGSPVDCRNRSEIEGLIGLFANTLVFRANFSGDPAFREVLRRAREAVIEAHANQDLPFEKLVEELNPERTLRYSPLFQVAMTLRDNSDAPLRLGSLSVTPLRLTAEVAKYDFTLSFEDGGEEILASMQYSTDLFEDRAIRQMLAHLVALIRGIVEDPDRRLSELPLMAAGERHRVLVEWNQTAVEYPEEMTVSRLFEEQVERTPDAVAVELEGERLTYLELNRRSNRLARYLRKQGVGPEALVGLCVKRSLDMVVALLGILKAGGAYLPLDPAYPVERLRYILEDSGASLVLADRAAAANLAFASGRTIVSDAFRKLIAAESAENPEDGPAPNNLAYVIYTSGSTGRPKGVEIEHRSLANYTQYAADLFALQEGDRVLQFASLSFDMAAEEIFTTLSRGATLVLRTDGMIATIAGFLEKCQEWNLTVLDFPTSYWHELAAAASAEHLRLPASLRLVIIGGEKALPERLAEWRELAGNRVRLLNGYGPSETTIASTFWEPGVEEAESSFWTVPIGRPISNTQTYVLDASLQPVPMGIVGELFIGGAGLARGYRNRADLTSERFIPDPFGEGGARLYRTGDRVRYRPDGQLEYMGRVDEQVKLRGFRVEPGEVEAALRAHPAVEDAAVALKGAQPPRLVAYLVAKDKQALVPPDIRVFLKKVLPDFMIPATFVMVSAFPLTLSGKVDRRALPEPGSDRPELERDYVSPRDALEIKLTRIWERVLGVKRIGTQDDFFELGGHSLLAVRLLFEIEKAFDRRLPLTVIFDAPTVGKLAVLLRKEGWSPSWSSLVPIQPGGSRVPFYCVHAIGGHVLDYRDLARHLGPEQPLYALQAQGLDGKQPPRTKVEEMAACYVREIRKLQRIGPYFLGGYSFGGTVAFEMARQLRATGQIVPLVALIDSDNLPPPAPDTGARGLGLLWQRLRTHKAALSRLEPKARLPYFQEKLLIGLKWVRTKGHEYLHRVLHPVPKAIRMVLAANHEAAGHYVPGTYAGRVVLFRATNWRLTGLDDPSLGWGRVCTGAFEVIEIAGDHDDVISDPEVRTVARELAARLRGLGEDGGDTARSETDIAVSG